MGVELVSASSSTDQARAQTWSSGLDSSPAILTKPLLERRLSVAPALLSTRNTYQPFGGFTKTGRHQVVIIEISAIANTNLTRERYACYATLRYADDGRQERGR